MENRYLEVLRRELGNLIIRSDPDKMLKAYEKAEYMDSHYRKAPIGQAQVALQCLIDKYPMFVDFDFIETRHFIPYQETLDFYAIEEIIEWYSDVTNFLILSSICLDDTGYGNVINDNEKKVLQGTIQRIKNNNLKSHIDTAMQRFWLKSSILEDQKPSSTYEVCNYEDVEYVVNKLPYDSTPDIEYGIVVKSSKEYGIYAFFLDDSNNKFVTYQQADCNFENATSL